MNCVHCNDTGSLEKDLDGYLDCGWCEVPIERAKLGDWLYLNFGSSVSASTAWLIYLRGKAAALEAHQ